MGAGLRPRTKVLDEPPDPNVGAPLLDSPDFRGSFRELSICYKTHGQGGLQSDQAKRPLRRAKLGQGGRDDVVHRSP